MSVSQAIRKLARNLSITDRPTIYQHNLYVAIHKLQWNVYKMPTVHNTPNFRLYFQFQFILPNIKPFKFPKKITVFALVTVHQFLAAFQE